MSLVINNLRGGHTHTHVDVCIETILRNQAHAWFKNQLISVKSLKIRLNGEILNLYSYFGSWQSLPLAKDLFMLYLAS